MYQVVKRDGTVAEFNISKISAAITKAFVALEKDYHSSVIDLIALRVASDFESKVKDGKITDENRPDAVIFDFNELKEIFPKAPHVAWDKVRRV